MEKFRSSGVVSGTLLAGDVHGKVPSLSTT